MCERPLVALALKWTSTSASRPRSSRTCLRILREAIVNAGRHGLAEKVTVRLWEDDRVHLTIEDDGRGFDPVEPARASASSACGSERRAVGGELRLELAPRRGTRIEVIL